MHLVSSMNERRLRLVHSVLAPEEAGKQRSDWGFENARQLNLFSDLGALRIVIVPVAEISARKFVKALDAKSPSLLLDTRAFPDFFAIFPSTAAALLDFKKRKIQYSRVPISLEGDADVAWKQLSDLKAHLKAHLQPSTNAPIFLLASTRSNLDLLSARVMGYISQEISGTKFEELV